MFKIALQPPSRMGDIAALSDNFAWCIFRVLNDVERIKFLMINVATVLVQSP